MWVAGGSGRVFIGCSTIPHLSSIRRTGAAAASGASASRSAMPSSPWARPISVYRIGAAKVS